MTELGSDWVVGGTTEGRQGGCLDYVPYIGWHCDGDNMWRACGKVDVD